MKWTKRLRRNRLRNWGWAAAGTGALLLASWIAPVRVSDAATTWQNITGTGVFSGPTGIAVNGAGDLFVTNSGNNTVEERPYGSSTWQTLSGGSFSEPFRIVADGTGDLFVTNSGNNTVEELPSGSSTWQILPSGSFDRPQGIAVDSRGDVFVTNGGNNSVEELPYGSSTWKFLPNGSFDNPVAIAVDSAGDLFVANYGNNTVEELSYGSSTWQTLSGGAFHEPEDIIVDSAGDLFVTNDGYGDYTVEELPHGSTTWQTLTGGPLDVPSGIAVDSAGNVYVTNYTGPYFVVEGVRPWTPPVLTPEPVTLNGQTVQVIGSLGYNAQQAVDMGTYAGFVEERAAIESGVSFGGEGTDSSYLVNILCGNGVAIDNPNVTPVQQGQFAALYQKLGVIPTWTDNMVFMPQAIRTLLQAGASPLAIENYLVQLDGYSWASAKASAAAGFPMPNS